MNYFACSNKVTNPVTVEFIFALYTSSLKETTFSFLIQIMINQYVFLRQNTYKDSF